MNEVARQLGRHRRRHIAEAVAPPFRAGALLGAPVISKVSKEGLLGLALESAERLCLQSNSQEPLVRFLAEHPLIVSEHGVRDRAFLSQSENQELDSELSNLLLQMGEYWISLEGLTVIEFFIKVFRIETTHFKELFFLALPFHDSPVFGRICQLLVVPQNHPLIFLDRIKESKVPLDESSLVKRMSVAPELVSLFINGLLKVIASATKCAAYRTFLTHLLTSLVPLLPPKSLESDIFIRNSVEDFETLLSAESGIGALSLITHLGRLQLFPAATINHLLSVVASSTHIDLACLAIMKSLSFFIQSQAIEHSKAWRQPTSALKNTPFNSKLAYLPADKYTGIALLPAVIEDRYLWGWLGHSQKLISDESDQSTGFLRILLRSLIVRSMDSNCDKLATSAVSSAAIVQPSLFHELLSLHRLSEKLGMLIPSGVLETQVVFCQQLNPARFLFLVAAVDNKRDQRWLFRATPNIDSDFIKSDLFKVLRGVSQESTARDFLLQQDSRVVFSTMLTNAVQKLISSPMGSEETSMTLIQSLVTENLERFKLDDLMSLVNTLPENSPLRLKCILKNYGLEMVFRELLGHPTSFKIQAEFLEKNFSFGVSEPTLKSVWDTILEQRPIFKDHFFSLMALETDNIEEGMESVHVDCSNLLYLADISDLDHPVNSGAGGDFAFIAVWQDLRFKAFSAEGGSQSLAVNRVLDCLSLLPKPQDISFVRALNSSFVEAIEGTTDISVLVKMFELDPEAFTRKKSTKNAELCSVFLCSLLTKKTGSKLMSSLSKTSKFCPPPWLHSLAARFDLILDVANEKPNPLEMTRFLEYVTDFPVDSDLVADSPLDEIIWHSLHLKQDIWQAVHGQLTQTPADRLKWSESIIRLLSIINFDRIHNSRWFERLGCALQSSLTLSSTEGLTRNERRKISTTLKNSIFRTYEASLKFMETSISSLFVTVIESVISKHEMYWKDLIAVYLSAYETTETIVLRDQLGAIMTHQIQLAGCVTWEALDLLHHQREPFLSVWLDAVSLLDSEADSLISDICLRLVKNISGDLTAKIVTLAVARAGLKPVRHKIRQSIQESLKAGAFQGICLPFSHESTTIDALHGMTALFKCLDKEDQENFVSQLFVPWLLTIIDQGDEVISQASISSLRLHLPQIFGHPGETARGLEVWFRIVETLTQVHLKPFLSTTLSRTAQEYLSRLELEMQLLSDGAPKKKSSNVKITSEIILRTDCMLNSKTVEEEKILDEEWNVALSRLETGLRALRELSSRTREMAWLSSLSLLRCWLSVVANAERSSCLDERRLIRLLLRTLETLPCSAEDIIHQVLSCTFQSQLANIGGRSSFKHQSLILLSDGHNQALTVLAFLLARTAIERHGVPSILARETHSFVAAEDLTTISGFSTLACLCLNIQRKTEELNSKEFLPLRQLNTRFLNSLFESLSPIHAPVAIASSLSHPETADISALFDRASQAIVGQTSGEFVYTETGRNSQTSPLRDEIKQFEADTVLALFRACAKLASSSESAATSIILWLALLLVHCPFLDVSLSSGLPILLEMVKSQDLHTSKQTAFAFALTALGFSPACLIGDWTDEAVKVLESSVQSTSDINRWVVCFALMQGVGQELLELRPKFVGEICWSQDRSRSLLQIPSGSSEEIRPAEFWAQLISSMDNCSKPQKAIARARRQLGRSLLSVCSQEDHEVKSPTKEIIAFSLRSLFEESETTTTFALFFSELKVQLKNLEAVVLDRTEQVEFPANLIMTISSLAFVVASTSSERLQILLDTLSQLASTLFSFFINTVEELSKSFVWNEVAHGNIFETFQTLFEGDRLKSTAEVELIDVFNFPSTRKENWQFDPQSIGMGEVMKALNLLVQSIIRKLEGDQITNFIRSLLGAGRCGVELMLTPLRIEENQEPKMKQDFGAKTFFMFYRDFAKNWGALAIISTFHELEDHFLAVLRAVNKCVLRITHKRVDWTPPSNGKKKLKRDISSQTFLTHGELDSWFEVGVTALSALSESCRALSGTEIPDEVATVSNDLIDVLISSFDIFASLPRIPCSGAYVGMYASATHPSAEITKAWLLVLRQAVLQVLELSFRNTTQLSFVYSKFLEKFASTNDVSIQSMIVRCLHQAWAAYTVALLPVLSESLKTLVDLLDSPDPELNTMAKAWVLTVERVTGESLASRLSF